MNDANDDIVTIIPTHSPATVVLSTLSLSQSQTSTQRIPIVLKSYNNKQLSQNPTILSTIQCETQSLIRLSSIKTNYFPKLLRIHSTKTATIISMTRTPGIPLSKLQSPISILTISKITKQLISAIHELHTLNIIHADIIPRNIVIDDNKKICIIDFGSSFLKNIQRSNHPSYTSSFISLPTSIHTDNEKMSPLVDIWACGTLIWVLYTQHFGFNNIPYHLSLHVNQHLHNVEEAFWKDCAACTTLHFNHALIVLDFIKCCMNKQPTKRFCKLTTITEIYNSNWSDIIDYEAINAHPLLTMHTSS